MSLTLYFHPLSSYCQKVLIALYENDTAFEPLIVDLGKEPSRSDFLKIWPIGKFPVLRDDAKGRTIPESSIIIEYLAQHYPGRTQLIPAEADLALQVRVLDRFFDLDVHTHMQKIVGDRLRPATQKDPLGVAQARQKMETAYGVLEKDMAARTWAAGDVFTLADCAAAPALYYANLVAPFGESHKNIARYFERLMARPSFKRAVDEAEPYRKFFPQ
jgi:glutathione S-transferase